MTDSELFTYLKNKTDYKVTGLDFDYKVETNESEKCIDIYFKESDSFLDWRINFNFLPTFAVINNKFFLTHRGYEYAYLSGYSALFEDIVNEQIKNPLYKINVYGWSYGSAIASRCFIELVELGYEVDKVITFGSVKSWYFPFLLKKYKEKANIREYTTPNDFVTWQVPFCHRINKKSVGEKFSLFKIFNTAYYHCNYDLFIKE